MLFGYLPFSDPDEFGRRLVEEFGQYYAQP